MTIETYELDFLPEMIDNARNELFNYEQEKSEQKCVWGYFPGLEKEETELYPHCIRLAEALRAHFLKIKHADWVDAEPTLSFIKLASTKPKVQFGGLHIDDKVNATDAPDSHSNKKILRIIINLGEHPRKLKYIKHSAEELRAQGVHISKDEYHPIDLPITVETNIIEIPGRKGNQVSLLKFFASDMPHVGATDEHGYFIVGYGKYC